MTVTSASVARGGGHAPRASISGYQWTEASVARGGGRAPDTLIGSSRQVINVKSWDPADNDAEVLHGRSVLANLEALNSNELEALYDEGADFLPGTFNQTAVVGDALNLATSSPDIDFEAYVNDQTLVHATQPDDWVRLDQKADSNTTIRDDVSGEPDNQYVRALVFNSTLITRLEDAGSMMNGTIVARVRSDGTGKELGVFFRTTGAGSGLRGHALTINPGSQWAAFKRLNDWDSWFGIQSIDIGFTAVADTWYWMKVNFYGTVNTQCRFKIWEDGDAEPGTWKYTTTDSTYLQSGYVGICSQHSTSSEQMLFDDFAIAPDPPTYLTPGTWIDFIDVTSVDHYSEAIVSWDEDEPANTTVVVSVRWPEQSPYQVQTQNPQRLKGIAYEKDMRAGSTKHTLEIKVGLTTTDTSVTPSVSNLRIYFEPIRAESLELTVHGAACVPDDNSLLVWGRGWIGASGVPPTIEADWSDLWIETNAWWLARDLQTVAAALEYWGNAIDSITFDAEGSKYRHGYLKSYFTIPITPRYSGPTDLEFTTLTEWNPNGKIYEWILTDKGMAIHADAKWIVGHAQIDDHPLSLLVSVPNLTDHPLSVQVRGWQRDDHLLSMLIQGWRRDDYPLSVTVGIWTINDQPISMLAAIEYLNDHPLSMLVYGVSREGMIEVNIIDDTTWAELVALGFTRSD